MIQKFGYADTELVKTKFPNEDILVRPKAIIECYQEIPCNPCETSCPFNAIMIGSDINHQPVIDYNLCTGCGACVYSCPGLAIMVAQLKQDRAYFKVPYELLPVPKKGDIWHAINRQGEVLCDAKIESVLQNSKTDRTVVITASVPKQYLFDFITVRNKV
ncbi:MAG: 4Fe-4S binding protein [Bacilli bacterium]|nr:4Fe-4S binding protein [Bacilli bacterium]MBN2877846.1 4Fe-4S binding protein [Bacilli bacterium]